MLGLFSNKSKVQSETIFKNKDDKYSRVAFFLIFIWLPSMILIREIRNEHSFVQVRTCWELGLVLGF